jgi:hypothetical protein
MPITPIAHRREGAHVAPQGAPAQWRRRGEARDHADMRLTCGPRISCGERGVGASSNCFSQPAGRRNRSLCTTQFRAPSPAGGHARASPSEIREFRLVLSAGRRACEPAAKPAIPGVILLHYGFVCYERTLCRHQPPGDWSPGARSLTAAGRLPAPGWSSTGDADWGCSGFNPIVF